MKKTSFLRSPLRRWVGSKYDFLPMIFDMIPKDIELSVEPFCGSAVFTLNLVEETGLKILEENNHRVINDNNKHICHLFNWISIKSLNISEKMKEYAELHSEGFYKSVVASHNNVKPFNPVYNLVDMYERSFISACDFLYLHYASFNGLYRENSKGKFNVPIGRDSKGNLLKISVRERDLLDAEYVLKDVLILSLDFRRAIEYAFNTYVVKKILFFIDPPYLNTFTGYNSSNFRLNDHLDLLALCKKINNCGHYFMLFNSNNILYRESLKGFNCLELSRKGIINCKGTERGSVKELMFYNFDT